MSLLEEFRFLDPGPLVDGELELVTPAERWIADVLDTTSHPLTKQLSPRDAAMDRQTLVDFIREYPMGRQPANTEKGTVPAYHFWMRLRPEFDPPVPMAGGCNLRIGQTSNIELYLGHIGYGVYPPARGRGYAARAVRLLMPLARRMGINPLWITCNPDNWASRRTCERAGGRLVNIVPLPPDHPMFERGERHKCRFRFDL